MKKIISSIAFLALGTSAAMAGGIEPVACDDPASSFAQTVDCGTFVELRSGNDASGPLTIAGVTYNQLEKWDVDEAAWENGGAGYEFDGDTWGAWVAPFEILYTIIKAGNNFAIYSQGAGASSGYWATAPIILNGSGRDGRNLSHLSFYGRGDNPPVNVAEPGTLVLLGAGLLALGLRRRRSI